MCIYVANVEVCPELEKIPTIPEFSNGYMYWESKNVDMVNDTVVQDLRFWNPSGNLDKICID